MNKDYMNEFNEQINAEYSIFGQMLDGTSDEEWETWKIEKKGIDKKAFELIGKISQFSQRAIQMRRRLEIGIIAVEKSNNVVKQAGEEIAWGIHAISKRIKCIIEDGKPLGEDEMVEVMKEDPKTIVKIEGGKYITYDIVEKVRRITQKSEDQEIENEPIIIDDILTLFKNEEQIKELSQSSLGNPDIGIRTSRKGFVIIYSKAPKKVNRLHDILGIGVIHTKKSIQGAIHSISLLGIALSPKSEKSLHSLKLLFRSLP